MSVIELIGLRPDLPIGAMAAFGVLRSLASCGAMGECRLRWTGEIGYRPVLETSLSATQDDLIAVLVANAGVRGLKSLTWTEQLKAEEGSSFAIQVQEILTNASPGSRSDIDWMSALANEQVTDDGKIESTPFDMSVAKQKFPSDAVKLGTSFTPTQRGRKQKTAEEEYREALFGPWRYEDDQHSFGWDPSMIKLGAFTYKAPTLMVNAGVRAAVWLAFESLPLFPVFAERGKQRTRGFLQNRYKAVLHWPIWSPPITVDELGSLLGASTLLGNDRRPRNNKRKRKELESRGLLAVYRSEIFKPNKYMTTFRPAELV